MTVITLTACPPALRGDLTLWLQEINTGTFVGSINARVRDLLWKRVLSNIGNGRATMVFSARNEQGMEYRIHNGSWEVVDYDGIKLVKRPNASKKPDVKMIDKGAETANKGELCLPAKLIPYPKDYVVVDLETTGLKPENSDIIEIGALKVKTGIIQEELSILVQTEAVPDFIREMTGITLEMTRGGTDIKEAIEKLRAFVGDLPIVAHNLEFDLKFIKEACRRTEVEWYQYYGIDTVRMARKECPGLQSYKLEKLLEHFGIQHGKLHRSLTDCQAIHALYAKLNEI